MYLNFGLIRFLSSHAEIYIFNNIIYPNIH